MPRVYRHQGDSVYVRTRRGRNGEETGKKRGRNGERERQSGTAGWLKSMPKTYVKRWEIRIRIFFRPKFKGIAALFYFVFFLFF
jgi:hypothetical protein